MADPPAHPDLARHDLLGGPATSKESHVGRLILAEAYRHLTPDDEEGTPEYRAAGEMELGHLRQASSVPSFTFRDIELKLALAHRCLQSAGGGGVYADAGLAPVGSCLSDLVLLRAAELARAEEPPSRPGAPP